MSAACSRVVAIVALLSLSGGVLAELVIKDGWVRATPPNSRTSAAYFTLINQGDEALVITRASASTAGAAELHNWVERDDGMKRMVRMREVPVAPGEAILFEPGGKHMMMFRLDPVPALGDIVTLCVGTETGVEACTEAPVRQP
ncbi:MAG: copper chaperone PCu(A)C [Alcanivoracaceae bacterium]